MPAAPKSCSRSLAMNLLRALGSTYAAAFLFLRLGQTYHLLLSHGLLVLVLVATLHYHRPPLSILALPVAMLACVLQWDVLAPQALTNGLAAERGLTVVVTGANSGLGLASARALRGVGATVILGCRSEERCAAAAALVNADEPRDAPTARAVAGLELSSLKSVRRWARRVRGLTRRAARRGKLVLVANAGMPNNGAHGKTTDEGLQLLTGCMYVSHHVLVKALRPTRVVHASSDTHHLCSLPLPPLVSPSATTFSSRGPRPRPLRSSRPHGLLAQQAAPDAARPRDGRERLREPGVRRLVPVGPDQHPALHAGPRLEPVGLMASAATAVAPLLVACVGSAERLDQLGPNGGVFLSGQLELRQALDLPGFRGLNASSLARSLWRDTESLLAALPEN